VDLDAIEAEAAELVEKDQAQAERFFGNRITAGTGTWIERPVWETRAEPREIPAGTRVVGGFDGSDMDDWTALRLETLDGYQFTPTYGPDARPTIWDPAEWDGQVPRLEVDAAVREVFARYDVVRFYCDPPYWETEVDTWADVFGEKRVVRWYTNRVSQMHAAAERLVTDVTKADATFRHDGCPITAVHVGNARKAARPGGRYVLRKAAPTQKIDAGVTSVLAHEAAGDAIAAGQAAPPPTYYAYTA
jgi:phage terminase large subunit-like protein